MMMSGLSSRVSILNVLSIACCCLFHCCHTLLREDLFSAEFPRFRVFGELVAWLIFL